MWHTPCYTSSWAFIGIYEPGCNKYLQFCFCFLICFVPHNQHFWNCWSDLFWSPWERERSFYGKLRSWGNLIQEQPKSKQQGTLHYEIHMRILLLPSTHIMILWKEFPHYTTHNNYIWHPRCQIHYHISLGHMPIMHKYMLV